MVHIWDKAPGQLNDMKRRIIIEFSNGAITKEGMEDILGDIEKLRTKIIKIKGDEESEGKIGGEDSKNNDENGGHKSGTKRHGK